MGITTLRRHHTDPQYGMPPDTRLSSAQHQDIVQDLRRQLASEGEVTLQSLRNQHASAIDQLTRRHALEVTELRQRIGELEAPQASPPAPPSPGEFDPPPFEPAARKARR